MDRQHNTEKVSKRVEFELFFKENYSCFFYYSLQILNDEEVCRDIVGDAFEYAWGGYNHRNDVSNWKTYLYSYIRNKCVDHIRHQMVEEKHEEFIRQMYCEKEEEYEEMEEQINTMREILSTLPPKTRLILQECYLRKKKYREVADEMEVSVSAVRKHIVKALKVLREGFTKKNIKKGV